MASTRTRCAVAVVILLAAGCELTLPWSSGTNPDPPRGLVATTPNSANIDYVELHWNATGYEQEYRLQMRVGSGEWQDQPPPHPLMSAWWVSVDPATPELTSLAFRLRARIGGRLSGWSEEATLLRGIRAPTAFAATARTSGVGVVSPIDVTWTNASLVADTIDLERTVLDAPGGNPTTWTPIASASLATGHYVDDQVDEGAAYGYRVRVGKDGAWSGSSTAQTPSIDLAAPSGLRAYVDGSVARVTWTNRSTSAESLSLVRYTRLWPWWDWYLDLPTTTTTWTEPMPVWPVTSYGLEAKRQSQYIYAPTAVVQIEPFTLAGPPVLAASAQLLPEHEYAARGTAGGFHLAQRTYETPRIHRATATGYDTHLLADATALASPGVLVDALGAPHTVFLRPAAVTGTEVVHEWWSGSAWQEEVIATDDVAGWGPNLPSAWFGLTAAGAIQALYRRPVGVGEELVHVARSNGEWVSTVVTTPSVTSFSRWASAFAVGPDGSAYVAMIGQQASPPANLVLLCTRSSAGAWSDETVPTGAFSVDGPWVVGGNGGAVAIGYFSDYDVQVLQKSAGGSWGSPELVVARAFDGYGNDMRLAATADLARLAVLTTQGEQLRVHVRDGSGWQGVAVGPGLGMRGLLGFDAAGQAWALFPHDSAGGGALLPYSLFEEP